VLSSELSQYLRLHHRDLTFEQTVEKARIYHSTMDGTKPNKSTSTSTPPPSPDPSSTSTTVPTSSCPATSQQSNWRPRGLPAAEPQQSDNRYGGQQSFQPRQPGLQPRPPTSTSNSFQTATPPVNRFNGPRPGFGRPRPGCLVCETVVCHSNFHRQGPPPTPPRSQSPGPGMGVRRRLDVTFVDVMVATATTTPISHVVHHLSALTRNHPLVINHRETRFGVRWRGAGLRHQIARSPVSR